MGKGDNQEDLLSQEFYRQFAKEFKKYNSNAEIAIALNREIEEAERIRLYKEEEEYNALEHFGAFI